MLSAINLVTNSVYILSFLFFLFISIKKCFWKENRSKVALFFLSLVTNPLVSYFLVLLLLRETVNWVLPVLLSEFGNSDESIVTAVYMLYWIGYALTGIAYLVIIFFMSKIVAKWLRVNNKSLVHFIYLMFGLFVILGADSTATGYPGELTVTLLNSGINVIVVLSELFIYKFVINKLSDNTDDLYLINSKIFIIPPSVFILIYSTVVLSLVSLKMIDVESSLIIFGFAILLAVLFIWVFGVLIRNINATNEAVKAKEEVKTLSVEVMEALAHTIDAKDEYTKGHSMRVAIYARMLAKRMGLSLDDCENIYYMGLLHDLGKIGVPNAIINSPTRLTDEEYEVIKTHPGLGFDILSEIRSRPDLVIGARWHHERYDGKGYPDGKSGEDIPLFARIIAVADSYDAMTSTRSYREYMPQDKVRAEIEKNSGTQFDPKVAECMISIIDDDRNYVLHE